MAESTLSLSFDEISAEVGDFLGFGRESVSWSTRQAAVVDGVIASGLRRFYSPPPLANDPVAHEWSFLKPVASLVIQGDKAGTMNGTAAFSAPTSTIKSIAATFVDSMAGDDVKFTHADVTGTMSGSATYAAPTSTVTATTAIFTSVMVGDNLVFDASGNKYEITLFTGSTVVGVAGDASAETSGGNITVVKADTLYPIVGVTGDKEVEVTGDASNETSGSSFTVVSDADFPLPDDFGGIEGRLTYTMETRRGEIFLVGENLIREYRQGQSVTAAPRYAAIRPLFSDGTSGQRFEIMFWPKPDASYTLRYKYMVSPNDITDAAKWPLGGMFHADTILQSCLSIAELRVNDERGVQWQAFMERLAASVHHDRNQMTPETLGYNADASLMGSPATSEEYRSIYGGSDVTVGGTQY